MRLDYFLLIDRIVELKLAESSIRAAATVPAQSTIFEGHFPGYPLMPGVLLIETMAQTAGWLVVALTRFKRMPFLASVKQAKLRTFVHPGQVLDVSADLVHDGSGFSVIKTSIAHNAKRICDAEITLRLVEIPNQQLREWMEKTARELGMPMKALVNG